MDKIDEKILDLMKGNARISYQKLGDAVGMSRVAAKKRVHRLEQDGIIRGYNTCIYREDEITLFLDIETTPDGFEEVLDYVATRTAYIRQIFRTTKENHLHIVAVSDSTGNLKYLTNMIMKQCGGKIVKLRGHAVKEVIKDVYGGISYEQRSESDRNGDHESDERSQFSEKGREQLPLSDVSDTENV